MELKEGYKNTEVGIIPEDWEVKSLLECCSKITDGTHDTPIPVETGIPFLTAIHVKENNIDYQSCYYLPENVHRIIFNRCNPEKNDVLMVNIGAGVATTALVNVDYEFSLKNVALLKPELRKLVGAFLNYWQIYSKSRIINSISTGGAQPFLSLNQIGNLKIALPTKAEQTAIATALSDADALINSLEKLIAKKRNIKQGAMQQLLQPKEGWEVKKLGEIADFFKGKGLPKSHIRENGRYKCIHYGELFTKYKESISNILSYTDENENCFYSVSNDVLMPTSDVTPNGLATASCVKEDGIILGGDVLVIRISPSILDGLFLSFYVTQNREQVMKLVSGSTVYHLYGSDMKDFEIIYPKIEEQNEIAIILSDMDAEIQALETKLEKYHKIKLGMMQNLLTGKIRLV